MVLFSKAFQHFKSPYEQNEHIGQEELSTYIDLLLLGK